MPESDRSAARDIRRRPTTESGGADLKGGARHLASVGPSEKPSAKQKAVRELRELFINALYLALFLCAFSAYRALITGELLHESVYLHLGTSIITALIMAKMIMVGGWLNLGGRSSEGEPLLWRTLYRSLIYTAFIIAFAIIEKTVEGLIHGRSVSDTMRALAHLGWDELGARAIVILAALIPFFAFRELADREGRESVYEMFVHRRAAAG
jgi:hypothetical protein